MLYDATGPDRARFTDPATPFDVCIIGTGPAGITLARRLAERGLSVALMEAGGLEFSEQSQDVYIGEEVGLDYFDLDTARLRYLGGTSGHWGGRCRPLDAWDFEPRAANPLSGWPIAKADLDPYQAEAAAILELPAGARFDDLPVSEAGPGFRQTQFHFSPPTRFGERYRDELTASQRISLALNANLVDLRLAPDLATAEAAVFRSYAPDDPGFTVRARAFALCAGGLETPRLLLNFASQKPAGIGNDHDLVGRFFCEHPHVVLGDAEFVAPRGPDDVTFAPTPAFMAEHGTLNFSVFLMQVGVFVPPLSRAVTQSARCLAPFTERLARRVLGGKVDCDDDVGIADWVERRGVEPGTRGRVRMVSEQSLQRDSRVLLAEATDAFGLRRIRFDWRVGELDYHTILTAARAFGESLATQGIGRMRLRDWLVADAVAMPEVGADDGGVGGWHHMCATRMSADPRTGVVDADCRVHGTANLYIGSSSTFATPGHANPTYTIVQLALRLGDHLAATLRRDAGNRTERNLRERNPTERIQADRTSVRPG